MVIDLILISIIVVFVIDLSGIIDHLKKLLWKLLKSEPYQPYIFKPFDCSLCMTWWISLIWLLITNQLSLITITVVCITSFLTPVIENLLILIKDILIILLNKILP